MKTKAPPQTCWFMYCVLWHAGSGHCCAAPVCIQVRRLTLIGSCCLKTTEILLMIRMKMNIHWIMFLQNHRVHQSAKALYSSWQTAVFLCAPASLCCRELPPFSVGCARSDYWDGSPTSRVHVDFLDSVRSFRKKQPLKPMAKKIMAFVSLL